MWCDLGQADGMPVRGAGSVSESNGWSDANTVAASSAERSVRKPTRVVPRRSPVVPDPASTTVPSNYPAVSGSRSPTPRSADPHMGDVTKSRMKPSETASGSRYQR
jgi:hypothetical protein